MLDKKDDNKFHDLISELGSAIMPEHNPHALAIGISTGGPQALQRVFSGIRGLNLPFPVFITQHMPAHFTGALAEQIGRAYGKECHEAKDGEDVISGGVYLAPGNYHMVLGKNGSGVKIKLSSDNEVNFCRPSVDVMVDSLIHIYGSRLVVMIMTGMGHDGLESCKRAVKAGATVIAQDAASSAVWGMPRAVADAGICKAVLPLGAIPHYIQALVRGRI